MIRFLSVLKYADYPPAFWMTTHLFIFVWRGRRFSIPAGMVLDFFSIPRVLHWWRRPNQPGHNEAALTHDFLRRFRLILGLTMAETDAAFLDAMVETGMKPATARRKWRWVRLLSWMYRGKGDGTPPRDVRNALQVCDDWMVYRDMVIALNGDASGKVRAAA